MDLNNRLKARLMKVLSKGTLLIILFIVVSGCTDDTQEVTTRKNLVMSDEFEVEGTPDPSIWGYDIGTDGDGWGNNELQYYTDRPENVTVQNGKLLITARKESFEGSNYTSSRLVTKGKFEQRYGRFEARMRLPYGSGIWPAFWMLGGDIDTNPWPAAGEIDIMEYAGSSPTVVFGSVHGPGYSGGEAITKEYKLQNDRFDTKFHVFGIEWGPKYINYYVDDILYNQITPADVTGEWVYDKPFYILINLAIGGPFGVPNDETVFPQTMLVDYVRVYY
jgi:beta-glucanase (GH16 family)